MACRVAIIVVTYNSQYDIDDCLAAVERAVAGDDVHVIVVDNASTDDTVSVVRSRHPVAQLVPNSRNLGFAGGCNSGIRVAIKLGCEFVYLLNPDTEVEPAFLREGIAVADAMPRAAAVQSLVLIAGERPERVNTAGNEIHFLGFGHCGAFRRLASDIDANRAPEVAFASGAAVLYRTEALEHIGMFDDGLFLYQEDMDVGIRLRLAGWISVLAPRSRVNHRYHFHRGGQKNYWLERNRLIVLAKNLELQTLLLLTPALAAAEIAVVLEAARQGWLREKLRATFHLLTPTAWRHVRDGRRLAARIRRVRDEELVSVFTPVLEFEGVTTPAFATIVNPAMAAAWRVLRKLIR